MTLYHRKSGQCISSLLRVPRQDQANEIHKNLSNYSFKKTIVKAITMKPVFRGTFVIIAICVLLYEHMEMATGQPRIEVSIALIIFVLTFYVLLIDLTLLWILATVFA